MLRNSPPRPSATPAFAGALSRKPASSPSASSSSSAVATAAAPRQIASSGSGSGTSSSSLRAMKPVSISRRAESRVKQRVEQEAGVGLDRPDLDLVEHAGQLADRLVAVVAAGDQLGDHRVVEGRDLRRLPRRRFRSGPRRPGRNARAARRSAGSPLRRILGIEPRLDRLAVDRQLVLLLRQLLAARHAQLPFDQVLAGDLLGHRMLDLQPRVHFHEPDAVGA